MWKAEWGCKVTSPGNSAIRRDLNIIMLSSPNVIGGKDFNGASSDNMQRAVYRELKMVVRIPICLGHSYISGCMHF